MIRFVQTKPFDEPRLCDIRNVAQRERRLHVQEVDFHIGSHFPHGDDVLYRVICAAWREKSERYGVVWRG